MYKNVCTSYIHMTTKQFTDVKESLCSNSEEKINYIKTEKKKKDYSLYGCTPDWKQRTKEIAPEQDK